MRPEVFPLRTDLSFDMAADGQSSGHSRHTNHSLTPLENSAPLARSIKTEEERRFGGGGGAAVPRHRHRQRPTGHARF